MQEWRRRDRVHSGPFRKIYMENDLVEPPPLTRGLHHVALAVNKMEACVQFYTDILGMRVEWQPDADNVYLTSGEDNLALHRVAEPFTASQPQRLDHIGFILQRPEDVDVWHNYLVANDVPVLKPPKTHRDGARSFYCKDPDGNVVQMIYHPPLAKNQ
jgi:catechol 2,3-dioxygenase-like lactoylglutathione lyase family enzyme